MIVDAHQHFWLPARGDYGWLTPALPKLYRSFMPSDLAPLLQRHRIDGTILVQAAPSIAETEFLLKIADDNPFVLGVVGWVDFASPWAAADIERLAKHPKLVALRPMIQDIDDEDWMLGPDLEPAFNAMVAYDLAFEALIKPSHLWRLHVLIIRHPNLRVIIDHAAKPDIANNQFETWAKDMAVIATYDHVFCKLSGLVTEANSDWSLSDLTPYIEHLFTNFGANRLIWGSDWPVMTLNADYQTWFNAAKHFTSTGPMTYDVFGGNALKAYKLPF